MTIEEVLREMREWDSVASREWADAIEAAMREPKAYISHTSQGDVLDWEPQFDAPSRTKLYALPPDAAGEIERLKAEVRGSEEEFGRLQYKLDQRFMEIERLKADIDQLKGDVAELTQERGQLRSEIELLNKLLTECVQYVPLQVMSCEGHKCDEPWCTSCNTEDDAREAVDEANAVLQRVRSRPRR